MKDLVSVQWLFENRNDPNLIILDATIPQVGQSGAKLNEFCIPNSRFFNLKRDFCDLNGDYPNTFPSARDFQESSRKLGINKSSKIVIYDKKGIYSSARAWYIFHKMGHKQVSVLNGGFPEWLKKRLPYGNQHTNIEILGDFVAKPDTDFIRSYDEIIENIDSQEFLVLDARSEGRFSGKSPEPRSDISSGHIPHSVSIPYIDVLDDGLMRSKEEIRKIFHGSQATKKPFVFSCGSGITACVILLAYRQISEDKTQLFDGSWTEYAMQEHSLIVKN